MYSLASLFLCQHKKKHDNSLHTGTESTLSHVWHVSTSKDTRAFKRSLHRWSWNDPWHWNWVWKNCIMSCWHPFIVWDCFTQPKSVKLSDGVSPWVWVSLSWLWNGCLIHGEILWMRVLWLVFLGDCSVWSYCFSKRGFWECHQTLIRRCLKEALAS